MVYREPEELRSFRERSRQAVKLAMDSRWEEAAALNRDLTMQAPDDLDSHNRLGRALLELGDTRGARSAFERSLTLDPANGIARKNLDRLSDGAFSNGFGGGMAVAHRAFIGEAGRCAQVALLACAPSSSRPYVAPGAAVELREQNGNMLVFTCKGEFLGIVPPGLGRRLAVMMEGGNQYSGALVSNSEATVQVLLHETFQHPSLRSKVSFPTSCTVVEAAVSPPAADDEPEPAAVEPADEDPIDLLGLDLDNMESDEFSEVDEDDIIEDDEDEDGAEGEELDQAI